MDGRQAFDPEVPSIARTYDYLLGGKDNFPADREIGDIFFRRFPGAVRIALDNRACLVRAVGLMAGELGIDQFIDLGSGLPTASNVHQVAQRANPAARVVYVDNDPIVLAHGRALLAENDLTTVIQADLRKPQEIVGHPEVRQMIDFGRPVGIIASAILHHFLDEESPVEAIREFRDATPPGSYLFVSHFRTLGDEKSRELEAVMLEAFGRGVWRTTEEIAEYFGDMTLLAPGIVECALWRPAAPADPRELTDWQRLIVAGLGIHLYVTTVVTAPDGPPRRAAGVPCPVRAVACVLRHAACRAPCVARPVRAAARACWSGVQTMHFGPALPRLTVSCGFSFFHRSFFHTISR